MRTRSLIGAASALALAFTVPALAHEDDWAESAGADTAAAAPAQSGPAIPESALPADPRFSAARLHADVGFFADDLLLGRDTGSLGHEIAARYVAARFASLGLTPLGDNGTYLQRITFQKTERGTGPTGLSVIGADGKATSFAHGKDVLVGMDANEPELDVRAPLVFVGYGLENARLGLNDYAGLDVKGKIVVLLSGFPEGLPSEEAAHASATKGEIAAAHGAIGVISIGTIASDKIRPWERSLQYAATPSFAWVGADGKAFDSARGLRANARVDNDVAAALFAGAGHSYAQIRAEAVGKRSPRGFALKTSVRVQSSSIASRVTSPNVVAMLPGSDPALKAQYVVLSGHIDHLGVDPVKPGEPADKDRIYNGAMDNAAGTSTLLEVARVMSEDTKRPRRSVIFLVSTGEEKGLLGADYFARHPAVPIRQIVGNVDLDMPVLLYPFTDVIAFGADHSSLGKMVADAVAPMHVALSPDPMPNETIFVRSDHYQFVKQGVPAVFLATGFANGGAAKWQDFLAHTYHKPGDDMSQAFDWQAGARFAEANWRITSAMANSDTPPLWYKGDFFGDIFARDAQKAAK